MMSTQSTLQYLLALCHKKNELNRKRRRFYNLANPRARHYSERNRHVEQSKQPQYLPGYEQAKKDMRAMTAEMRQLRKILSVEFRWTHSGSIRSVNQLGESGYITTAYSSREFKEAYESEIFEQHVLGNK